MDINNKFRTFLACDQCRKSKIRCVIKEDDSSQNLGLSGSIKCQHCTKCHIDCQFTPTTYQLRKRLKLPANFMEDDFSSTIHNLNHQYRKKPHVLDTIILPNKNLLIKVVNEFFDDQYHSFINFLHRKSYIDWIRSQTFEYDLFNYDDPEKVTVYTPCTLIAILALVSRNNYQLSQIYGTFDESNDPKRYIPDFHQTKKLSKSQASTNSSRYFAYYAEILLNDLFVAASVQTIQSLTILSSHEWSEGNYVKSSLYTGSAARMASILGLCSPDGTCYKGDESFISKESKRRTIWAVYMMDRCNSSGRNKRHAIKIEDIEVSLPCPEENFNDDIEIEFPNYTNCFKYFDSLTSLDFTIISFELWSKVAKLASDLGARELNLDLINPDSMFNKLYSDLELLKEKLPKALHIKNLDVELLNGNLNFGYLHQLLNLCEIFLKREYFYNNLQDDNFTENLIKTLASATELNEKLINLNSFIHTPFTFFQIYTNCVTCLIMSLILQDSKLKEIGLINLQALENNTGYDQLIPKWYKICDQLKYYSDKSYNLNLNLNFNKFKNLLNDFGDCEILERLSTNEPQKYTKVDINDILSSAFSSSISSFDDNNYEFEKFIDSWEKSNLNDIFSK